MDSLLDKAKNLPPSPGVYKFLGQNGEVLYIGKAKNLAKRVKQYFDGHDTRSQLPFLMSEAIDLDYIVSSNELESLFLENTLIKKHLPPYNIKLRDDKNYAFIKIDFRPEIPQLLYSRKIDDDSRHARFFGPYSSAQKIRKTLDFIRRVFPYCSHDSVGKRPCFYFHLHRCPGVCIGAISVEEYKEQISRISLFLNGQTKQIKKELSGAMKQAAHKKQFEAAARFRDQLNALSVLDEKQLAQFPQKVNWDFVSLYLDNLSACVNLFKIREGKLVDKENFIYENILYLAEADRRSEIIQSFSETYYSMATNLPKEIYFSDRLTNQPIIDDLLNKRSKNKIQLKHAEKGAKAQLLNLGEINAKQYLQKWQASQASNADLLQEILAGLKDLLGLPTLPRRIEGFDISNTQGTNPVGSMVVAKDGQPAKSEYRKFKITGKQTPDDFAMMAEMLRRRLLRSAPNEDGSIKPDAWPIPDLMVIDGGKGQLGIAVEILEKYSSARIPVIGLAKRIEEIFLPGISQPIVLGHDNPILQLLQRLRDEAHRFGITFHRSLRSKAATKSALDDIVGIGPKTKKLLKQKFGTVANIRQSSLEELAAIVGQHKAEIIKASL